MECEKYGGTLHDNNGCIMCGSCSEEVRNLFSENKKLKETLKNYNILKEKSDVVQCLRRQVKKLVTCIKFVINNSGTSTDYNKQARECLEELGLCD